MQQIKTSRILMLQIKLVAKLKSSREKPAIRYVHVLHVATYVAITS